MMEISSLILYMLRLRGQTTSYELITSAWTKYQSLIKKAGVMSMYAVISLDESTLNFVFHLLSCRKLNVILKNCLGRTYFWCPQLTLKSFPENFRINRIHCYSSMIVVFSDSSRLRFTFCSDSLGNSYTGILELILYYTIYLIILCMRPYFWVWAI